MDNVTMIRVAAGILAVVVLFVIILRRKRKSLE
jgi:LPXTG-motif cell wall-anchored protein